MSLFSRDPILLTPGPLTTSLADEGGDAARLGIVGRAVQRRHRRIRGSCSTSSTARRRHVCVPMQGSGTFAVEAAIDTLVPRDGHVLVLINGAYGTRSRSSTAMMGRRTSTFETAEDVPTTPQDVDRLLRTDPSITHVALVHCETSRPSSIRCRDRRRRAAPRPPPDRRRDELVRRDAGIDARTTPFDALIAASGKCVEGPPGLGFVFVRRSVLEAARELRRRWSLDLHDQWTYMEKTTQWRYTPPTHVVVAFDAALDQLAAEGGQPARLARLHESICETLVAGMGELGFRLVPAAEIQAPIILTFHAPPDPAYGFKDFYARVRDKGFILYPGKLTQVETFRVGCIGAVGPDEMRHAVNAVRDVLHEPDQAGEPGRRLAARAAA